MGGAKVEGNDGNQNSASDNVDFEDGGECFVSLGELATDGEVVRGKEEVGMVGEGSVGTLGRRGDRWNGGKVGQRNWLEMGDEGMRGMGGPWRR